MDNFDTVRKSFGQQAGKISAYHMSKSEYTDYLVRKTAAKGDEHSLEVAAGTCVCAVALAPYIKDIICLDLTQEMLLQGRKLADEKGIGNISFVIGNAEELEYADESFDLVVTRLSLHHFTDPAKPFREMTRVLKKGGKLVVWDMEATSEQLRDINDGIERMRDFSHTRILGRGEFEELFRDDFDLQLEESTLVPVSLESWMELTSTPAATRNRIVDLMKQELSGGRKTGFFPYVKGTEIMFDHRWLLLIGIKK